MTDELPEAVEAKLRELAADCNADLSDMRLGARAALAAMREGEGEASAVRIAALQEAWMVVRGARSDAIHSASAEFVNGVAHGYSRAELAIFKLFKDYIPAPPAPGGE